MKGLDAHFDRQLAAYNAKQDEEEEWQIRVEDRADDLQEEDPDLDRENAELIAGEQLHQEDIEARESYWSEVAYDRGLG